MAWKTQTNTDLTARQLAFLRYLAANMRELGFLRRRMARRTLDAVIAVAQERLRHVLEARLASPVQIRDNGDERSVEIYGAIRYRMHRAEKRFSVESVDECGGWTTECDGAVSLSPFLCKPRWRRVVAGSLRFHIRENLSRELARGGMDVTTSAARRIIDWLCRKAWRTYPAMARLRREGLSTKAARARLQDALRIDPALIDLGRRSCLPGRQFFLTQRWLTFVWRHESDLRRIQAQTPTLLAPAAAMLERYGVGDMDPVQRLAMWLRRLGVPKAGFRLLVRRSIRPFRSVIRRWPPGQGLEALLLALTHSLTPNGAVPLRPAMYRALYDPFGGHRDPSDIHCELAAIPTRFFCRAHAEGRKHTEWTAFDEFLRVEFMPVAEWLRATRTEGESSPPGDWSNWVRHADRYWKRLREEEADIWWSSPLSHWQRGTTRVTALTSSLQLMIEGQEMRHCVHDHVDDCRQGKLRVFHAESHGTRRERATIGLSWNGTAWSVWDVRGPCNRRLRGTWLEVARELAAHISSLPASRPRPLPRRRNCATLLIEHRTSDD